MRELFSIGHSNLAMDAFLAILEKHQIRILVDVRSRPYSRFQPWFSKHPLSVALKKSGIEYEWEGGYLGGLQNTSIHNPEFITTMKRVIELGKEAPTIILCSEREPSECHRVYKLSAWLHRHSEVDVMHITTDGLVAGRDFEQRMVANNPEWLWPEFRGEPASSDDSTQRPLSPQGHLFGGDK